jgi:hypothetical protein
MVDTISQSLGDRELQDLEYPLTPVSATLQMLGLQTKKAGLALGLCPASQRLPILFADCPAEYCAIPPLYL